MRFRTDINGLRALAVIAVVLFHFNPSWVPGGFAGVDVFFLISGFLMTGIIFRGLDNKNFSLVKFYVARANRIIPALAIVCLTLIVFSWLYLTPLDYRTLSKHIVSSLGFFSNIVYFSESGYFDASSHSKWLLHTWSLSVEWQFYIIYPIALLLLSKVMTLNSIKRVLVVSTFVAFVFSVVVTHQSPEFSYFSLPTRAWEMMMGGIAFLYPLARLNDSSKKYLEWLGLGLIVFSYAFFSKSDLWPGYLALVPVLGAFFVIAANRQDSVVTNNVLMQKMGLWSYSIYLWHWPIVVMGYYFEIPHWEWMGLAISVLLGFCSYTFIESIKFPPLSAVTIKAIALLKPLWMAVFVGVVASYVYANHGVKFRVNDDVLKAENTADGALKVLDTCFYTPNSGPESKPCILGNKENIKAVVIGDSHALSLAEGVINAVDLKTEGVVGYFRAACPFILNAKNKTQNTLNCTESNTHNYQEIIEKYQGVPVFVINRTSGYIHGFTGKNIPDIYFSEEASGITESFKKEFTENYLNTVCSLSKTNPVFITSPIAELSVNVPKMMAKHAMISGEKFEISLPMQEYEARNQFVNQVMEQAKTQCGVTVLDTSAQLCDTKACSTSIDGYPLYHDDNHLSVMGAKKLTPMFANALK